MTEFFDFDKLNDKKHTFVVSGRNEGKSHRFNQLMDMQKISDEITFHKAQLDSMLTNYNILQDYYEQQLANMDLSWNAFRDDKLTQESIEVQIEEVKEESNKQFHFINSQANKHKLFIDYWNHRLRVLTIKELYGKQFSFCLYDRKNSGELPLFIFNTAFEFECWLQQNKHDLNNLSLDIHQTK